MHIKDIEIDKADIDKRNAFNISTVLIDLLWKEPFYSRILRSLNKVETDKISTAGVGIVNNNITLFWNRNFFASLKHKEVLGVLKHECLHIIFKHITERKREPFLLWNYGTDLAINSTIPRNELPKEALIPGEFIPKLKRKDKKNMSDEMIATYGKLRNLIKNFPKNKTAEYYFLHLNNDEEIRKMIMDSTEGNISGEAGSFSFDDHTAWDNIDSKDAEYLNEK
ncbi:hypothetical protein CL614_09285, partial [archaeon]|nr:hypothetical protein [archaeon]